MFMHVGEQMGPYVALWAYGVYVSLWVQTSGFTQTHPTAGGRQLNPRGVPNRDAGTGCFAGQEGSPKLCVFPFSHLSKLLCLIPAPAVQVCWVSCERICRRVLCMG